MALKNVIRLTRFPRHTSRSGEIWCDFCARNCDSGSVGLARWMLSFRVTFSCGSLRCKHDFTTLLCSTKQFELLLKILHISFN